MTAVEKSSALWLEQAVGHRVEGDLTTTDAEVLTAKIRAYVGVTWVLLSEAHNRRADRALGYSSWAEYVEAEFDMSRSYAYRLIAHARAVYELAEAAGITDVSPIGDIAEGATRNADIDEVAAEVEAQTAKLPDDATDEDRADVVRQALAKQTSKTTTTETTTTTFDPETGEIDSTKVETATSGSDQPTDRAEAPVDGAAGSGDDETTQDTADSEPDPEGRTPGVDALPIDPILGYRAKVSKEIAKVRNGGLLTIDPERAVEVADQDSLASLRWIANDLHQWADRLDQALGGRQLKAVK